jgi:hypothetical protein
MNDEQFNKAWAGRKVSIVNQRPAVVAWIVVVFGLASIAGLIFMGVLAKAVWYFLAVGWNLF